MGIDEDRDLKFNNTGDLRITAGGDLDLVSGIDNITGALFRRLGTPAGGYERVSRVPSGLINLDPDVSDTTVQKLSTGITTTNTNQIADSLTKLAALDNRIIVTSVTYQQSGYNKLSYVINYQLASDPNVYSTQYHL